MRERIKDKNRLQHIIEAIDTNHMDTGFEKSSIFAVREQFHFKKD